MQAHKQIIFLLFKICIWIEKKVIYIRKNQII